MSKQQVTTTGNVVTEKTSKAKSILGKVWRFVFKLIKIALFLASIAATAKFFSLLSNIHGKEMPAEEFVNGYPTIIKLINSELFMGLIFVITLGIFIYVGKLFWDLHEIAVHESQHKNSAHTTLVFALSLCGLFINKTWWVLAIVIAFTRWDIIGKNMSKIISNGVSKRKEEQA